MGFEPILRDSQSPVLTSYTTDTRMVDSPRLELGSHSLQGWRVPITYSRPQINELAEMAGFEPAIS